MINRLVSGIRDGVFQLRGTVKVNTSTKWNLARCINTTDLFKVKKLLASLQNKRFCIFMYLSVSILCHHFKYLLKKILLKKMARKNASRLDSSDRLSPHKDLFFASLCFALSQNTCSAGSLALGAFVFHLHRGGHNSVYLFTGKSFWDTEGVDKLQLIKL